MEENEPSAAELSGEGVDHPDGTDVKDTANPEFDARLAENIFSFREFVKSCFKCGALYVLAVPTAALAAYNVGVLLDPPVHKIPTLSDSDSLRSALEPTDPSSCDLSATATYPPSETRSAYFDSAICSDLFRFASLNVSYGDMWSIWAAVMALLVAISVFKNTLNRTFESYLTRAEQYVTEVFGAPDVTVRSDPNEMGGFATTASSSFPGNAISGRRGKQLFEAIRSYQFWRAGLFVLQLSGLLWMIVLSNVFVGSELAESLLRNQSIEEIATPEGTVDGLWVVYELIKQGAHPRYLTLHMVGFLLLAYVMADVALPLSPTSVMGLSRISRIADQSRLSRLERAAGSLGPTVYARWEWIFWVVGVAFLGSLAYGLALWVAGVRGSFWEGARIFVGCLLWITVNQWIGRRIANRFRWVESDLGLPSHWSVMGASWIWLFSASLLSAMVLSRSSSPLMGALLVFVVPAIAIGVRSYVGWTAGRGGWPQRIWGIRSVLNRYNGKRLNKLEDEIEMLKAGST